MRHWLLLGLAITMLAVLARWPAGWAWQAFATPELTASGLSGTIWSGRAQQLWASGQQLGALRWSSKPSAWLRLQHGLNWQLAGDRWTGDGELALGLGGAQLRTTRVSAPISVLSEALLGRSDGLRGRLTGDIEHASATAAGVQQLHGTLRWQDAALIWPQEVALGSIELRFNDDAPPIDGQFVDTGGPLQIQGKASFEGQRLLIDVRLAARGGDLRLRQALDVLGQPLPDGSRRLQLAFELSP